MDSEKAIFVKVDAIVLEYNEGKAGPSKLKGLCGVSKYPTFQIWKKSTLVDEIVGMTLSDMRTFFLWIAVSAFAGMEF